MKNNSCIRRALIFWTTDGLTITLGTDSMNFTTMQDVAAGVELRFLQFTSAKLVVVTKVAASVSLRSGTAVITDSIRASIARVHSCRSRST
jgi:hypothetical protein